MAKGNVRVFPYQTAASAAAVEGAGVAPAPTHPPGVTPRPA
ncbi:hypothetical protein [Streptomyces sp. NPDC003273]